jgi:hypothetical protein
MGSMPESEPQGQLVVNIIDEKARWTPSNMYMRYALGDWETTGYLIMTWKHYANAINKLVRTLV